MAYEVGDEVELQVGAQTHRGKIDSVMVRGTSDPLLRIELPDGRVFLRLASEVKAVAAPGKSSDKKKK